MDEFNKVLKYVKDQSMVKRYQELEQKIHQDEVLLEKYEELKSLQKQLVNLKTKKKPYEEIEKAYDAHYNLLLTHPLMGEYLDIVEMINNDLQMIQNIIASEINMDFS